MPNMPQNESEAVRVALEIREKLGNTPNPRAADIHIGRQLIEQMVKDLKKDQELRKWCYENSENLACAIEAYGFITAEAKKVIASLED